MIQIRLIKEREREREMNLKKTPDQEKLRICRIYYLGLCSFKLSLNIFFIKSKNFILAGFAFLPFLWLVNFVWFFQQAFTRKPFPEQNQIKKCNFYLLFFIVYEFKPLIPIFQIRFNSKFNRRLRLDLYSNNVECGFSS